MQQRRRCSTNAHGLRAVPVWLCAAKAGPGSTAAPVIPRFAVLTVTAAADAHIDHTCVSA